MPGLMRYSADIIKNDPLYPLFIDH